MPVAPAVGRTATATSFVVQLLRRRPSLARAALGALSALALSASPLVPQTPVVHADVSPSLAAPAPFMQSSFEQSIVDLVNQDRLASGLAPLDFDPWLLATARQRAADQVPQPTLNHYDPLGQLAFVKLLTRDGVGYQLAGENLARLRGLDEGTALRAED